MTGIDKFIETLKNYLFIECLQNYKCLRIEKRPHCSGCIISVEYSKILDGHKSSFKALKKVLFV